MEVGVARIIEKTVWFWIRRLDDPGAFIDKVWIEEILVGLMSGGQVDKDKAHDESSK
jgi:hypothetical protein